jgi:DNA-binding transcriptional LysR family regulator
MDLYQLEYFRVLCKYGSYTCASQELNVSQPAISMAIKKLEDECGGDIIDHKRKSFALTKKGESLLSWCVVIHNDMVNMMQDIGTFSSRPREIIRLTFPLPLCPELMTDVIPAFTQHHTGVALHIMQAGHLAIAASLTKGQADLGVLCQDMLTPALSSTPYKDLEYWACFSPTHPFHSCAAITPEMLTRETLLVPKTQNSITKALRDYLSPVGQEPHISMEDVFPDDVWQLARQGKGIAFVPKHKHGKHCAPLSPPLYSRLVIAWRKDEKLTQQKKELIDYMTQSHGEV